MPLLAALSGLFTVKSELPPNGHSLLMGFELEVKRNLDKYSWKNSVAQFIDNARSFYAFNSSILGGTSLMARPDVRCKDSIFILNNMRYSNF